MTMTVTRRGVNEDGSPHYHYDAGPEGHVLVTGPLKGTVTLADGSTVDISPDVIEVESPEHAGEIAHHIAARHEEEGHPQEDPENPFWHLCTAHCGPAKRADDHPRQAVALERARAQLRGIPHDEHRAEVAERLGVTLTPSTSSSTGRSSSGREV